MKRTPRPLCRLRLLAAAALLFAAAACTTSQRAAVASGDDTAPRVSGPGWSPRPTSSSLTLLHVGDTEAGVLADVNHGHGGVARARAVLSALRGRSGASIVLHAGDTMIPSPELAVEVEPSPGAKKRSALLAANDLLGLQATAFGNHDLDMGEAFLADAIKAAAFPWIASTLQIPDGPLHPLVEENTVWAHEARGRILRRAKLCTGTVVEGRCEGGAVGVVGASPESLRQITRGAAHVRPTDSLSATIAALQQHVDALRAEGLSVIVLLAHRQDVDRDLELFHPRDGVTRGLTGVDIVLSGGGENLLASRRHRLARGAVREARCPGWGEPCYPLVQNAVDGAPVVLVSTDGDLRHVGELVVSFDDAGVLTGVDARSRPWPLDDESLLELRAEPTRDDVSFELRTRDALQPLARVVGVTPVHLDGVREDVRNAETNLGNASADALLLAARRVRADVVAGFRSGGGLRASIGTVDAQGRLLGKEVTLLDVKTSLRFDSPVVVVDVTHAQLARTLEAALRGAGTTKGGFPQVSSGVELDWTTAGVDQRQEVVDGKVVGVACDGTRVRRLVLPGGQLVVNEGVVVEPERRVAVATVDFHAQGGDGWFPGMSLTPTTTTDTEQSSFIAWLTDTRVRDATLSSSRRIRSSDAPAPARCP